VDVPPTFAVADLLYSDNPEMQPFLTLAPAASAPAPQLGVRRGDVRQALALQARRDFRAARSHLAPRQRMVA